MVNTVRGKCVLMGDSCTGKTAICQALINGKVNFPKAYIMTPGVTISSKSVVIPDEGNVVEINLYDCSGNDVYLDLLEKMWTNPSMICLVFDVTSEASFQSCNKWIEMLKRSGIEQQLPGVLLANKTDLTERRRVSPKAGQELALKLNLQYFETSAKEAKNVEEPFFYLAHEWHKYYKEKYASVKLISSNG